MRRRMEKTPDPTDRQVGKIAQEPRKKGIQEVLYKSQEKSPERLRAGNTSEAAQERTSSSRDQDIEPDAGIAFTSGRQKLRQRRWQENRRGSGVTSEPNDSQTHWYRRQDSKAESGPNDGTSNTSELGQRKGLTARWFRGEMGEETENLIRSRVDGVFAPGDPDVMKRDSQMNIEHNFFKG